VSGAFRDREALGEREALVLDAQATASHSAGGALLEIAWARVPIGAACGLVREGVTARVVAPPPGAVLPRAVARVTGITRAEWARGVDERRAWGLLHAAARSLAPDAGATCAVIHFARFEEPLLRTLHARHGTGPFPLDVVCTHEIARRLLPELPRRTLRALAGYLGAGVPPERRAADHVVATAFVWRELVRLLAEREGVATRADLASWLARPVRRAPRAFPLARDRRRELPDRPGVYRLQRAGGAVLYVGKAASLRQRVSGHYHAHAGRGERALEMLTQVRDLAFSVTETALEAALLESDEIKRLAPPFNVALAPAGRSVWFADAELGGLRERPDAGTAFGPFVSRQPLESLAALRAVVGDRGPAPLALRARAVGTEPPFAPEAAHFAAGLARYRDEHGAHASVPALLRLGSRLWAGRRDAAAAALAAEALLPPEEPRETAQRRPAWDAERVALALEETVLRAAHGVRRSRFLLRLSECSLAWAEADDPERRRLLVIEGGEIVAREGLARGAPLPVPAGWERPAAERRAGFDLVRFDRLRVLTTELRTLAAGAASVELRFGPHARLSQARLRRVLRWL
jgi:DNA polymerase-3 subunit epsilon